jgi:hypothetical protein
MALKRSRVRVSLGPSIIQAPIEIPRSSLIVNLRGDFLFTGERGLAVAKQKQGVLDNLGNRLREVLEDLERLLNPQSQPKRVPVPVPVRIPRPTPRNPYRR